MRKTVGVILDHPDLERGKGAGIGRYASLLVEGLGKHQDAFALSAIRRQASSIIPLPLPEVSPRGLPGVSRIISLWYLGLPLSLKGADLDIVHNPFQMPTYFRFEQKYVFTVHDVIPFLDPGVQTNKTVLTQRALLPRTLATADRIAAVSENTKQDLVRLFDAPEDKIDVVHTAVDPAFRPIPEADIDAILKTLGIERPYFLFVGTLEPRKNLVNVVKALREVRRAVPHAKLVIVGKRGWAYDEVFETAQALGLVSAVRYLGHLPEDSTVGLYNGATAFVYPSLYEGFGLPPAEAMACGTPAIASNTSSLPEVIGDAGIQVDPRSVGAIAEAMSRIATDESLREELRKAGLARAYLFSVEKLGESMARLYQKL